MNLIFLITFFKYFIQQLNCLKYSIIDYFKYLKVLVLKCYVTVIKID